MLQVRPGLLLGSRGDALAVLSRVPSITKQYTVTHVLTLANEPLEVEGERGDGEEGDSGDGDGRSDESCKGNKRRRGPPIKTMFVKVADMPGSDLLHSFESCIQFIKEGVEEGTVLVHWYVLVSLSREGLQNYTRIIVCHMTHFGLLTYHTSVT